MKCGQSRVRTYVHVSEQIYSLSPLTTRPSARVCFAWHSRCWTKFKREPKMGLEPATCWLQISCSTNWATSAKKRTSLFFGMAKVMEIFIWQNFAKIFFNDFTAFFSTTSKTCHFGAFKAVWALLYSPLKSKNWFFFGGIKTINAHKIKKLPVGELGFRRLIFLFYV